MFKRLMYMFTNWKDLETLVEEAETQRELAEFRAKQSRLNLCEKHQQEHNRSHFAEENCDYCKLLKGEGKPKL